MKSSVFDRPMFSKKPNAGVDVDNVGIMQGFKDQSEEDPEDVQEHQSDEDMEKMHMADRRPDAPEILMNNLRGNMQSVDARYEELAKLVGKSVARDTPEEILALLQPVLAEAQQGIGGLPGAQGMPGMPPPPSGMPTPPPPVPNPGLPPPTPPSGGAAPSMPAVPGQGAPGSFPPAPDAGALPAQGPAPMNMAHGGMVERVSEAGRSGDNQLAFLSPTARQMLRDTGGSGGINPHTGLHEYAFYTPILEAAGKLGSRMFAKPQVVAGFGPNAVGGSVGGRLVEGAQNLAAKIPIPSISGITAKVPQVIRNNPRAAATGVLGTGVAASYLRPADDPVEQGGVRKVTDEEKAAAAAKRDADAADAVANPEGGTADAEDAAPAPVAASTSVPAAPKKSLGTDTNDMLSKITARQGLLNQVIPGDTEGRQAQALFLLSDALAKMAYTGGRTPVEGIVKSFANVPAGLAQLGSQESARKQRINMAAAEQIFGEDAEGRKLENQLKIANARAGASAALRDKPIRDLMVGLRASYPDLPAEQLQILATSLNTKQIIPHTDDSTGQRGLMDTFSGEFTPFLGAKNQVPVNAIYKDTLGSNPNVQGRAPLKPYVDKAQMVKAREEITAAEDTLGYTQNVLGGKNFSNAFGISAKVKDAFGNDILLPILGSATPLTDTQLNAERNGIRELGQKYIASMAVGRRGIPVAEQDRIKNWFENPDKYFSNAALAMQTIQRVQTDMKNQIMANEHRLNPKLYPTLVQIDPNGPSGTDQRSAIDISTPVGKRHVGQLARDIPSFQPFVSTGGGAKPFVLTRDSKAWKTPAFQEALSGKGE